MFLFFLALSGIFWLQTTLNEVYEREFAIPVSVTGMPKNAVLTSDETDTVRISSVTAVRSRALYRYRRLVFMISPRLNLFARGKS